MAAPDRVLDTKGLDCPLPVLRARKAIKKLASGEVLEVQSTDPGAVQDFETFCEMGGHALLASREEGVVFTFVIRKA